MDYIREELKRQQKRFLLLLTGTAEQRKTAEESKESPEVGSSLSGNAAPGRTAEERAFPAMETETEDRQPEDSGQLRTAPYGKRFHGGEEPSRPEAAAAFSLDRPAAKSYLSLRTEVPGEGFFAAAKELSRAFERDARRYDGGYPLY